MAVLSGSDSTLAIGTSPVNGRTRMGRTINETRARTVLTICRSKKNNLDAGTLFLLNGKKIKLPSRNGIQIPRTIKVHVPD